LIFPGGLRLLAELPKIDKICLKIVFFDLDRAPCGESERIERKEDGLITSPAD
jgi:hypothetical protein